MADAVVSRLGQQDGAGDAKALFLKVFAGEVLTAFQETNVFESRTMVRSISSGKSAQFPATWKGTASYHTPGNELNGTTILHNERVISIDDLLVADRFIAQIDEAMNHYDVRSIYSGDVGRALAQEFDKHLAQVGYLAARATATVSGGNGGSAITDADADTNGASLMNSIFDAQQALDEKDVPDDGMRYVFVKPAQYYLLVELDKVLSRDFSNASVGDYSQGTLFRAAGLEVVKTNNLPTTNITTGPSAYQGNFTTSVALVSHKSATGTVKLMDLAVESEYQIQRQGTLIVAKNAVGHGILRPESAVEIKTA
jgi:hypothetical protein